MKSSLILFALIVLQTVCSGCSEEEQSTSSSERPPPRPPLKIVDAQITAVGAPDGEPARQVRAGQNINIAGTFRIEGKKKVDPPPVAISIRNRDNVIFGSTGGFSIPQGDGTFAFSGDIDTIAQPGDYTIEVKVLRDVIQKQDLKVVR